ncbi:MAG: peptide deformylase [Rhodospirillales bacterium]
MAILKIARMGHPVLHKVSEPVTDFHDPEIKVLVENMIETLEDSGGIGLAAPQIYVPKRIVILFVPRDSSTGDEENPESSLSIMINPEINALSDETNLDWEACLSVPGFMGSVERYSHIKYSWFNLDGKQQEREASGFHARSVQHECDHLDGKIYPMRMSNFATFGFAEEINRNGPLMRKGHGLMPDEESFEDA